MNKRTEAHKNLNANLPQGIQITGKTSTEYSDILTIEAIQFIADLHRKFNSTREILLNNRIERQLRIQKGEKPSFLKETSKIRSSEWKVAACPKDLEDRRVEITGPVEAKMMINALNSGAKIFMADLEDSCSPTWANIIEGQINLKAAVRKTLSFKSPEGKEYQLNDKTATLLVRPRGWHLEEKNFLVDGTPISASLFDFGLYFFHNAKEALSRKTGPYFYLPKMESHLEARLWNDVFNFAQDKLSIPRGSIRATVLIETILAAYEMEEILYELRDHMSGLNAGRWDYIFSVIKKFRDFPEFVTPDRSQITMAVSFMRAYTELLVKSCHKRGAHAIGGMSAFIPNRKDPVVTENALTKVREDKTRESNDGFDGTWVAHPDLVLVAKEIFDKKLGTKPNQKDRMREEVVVQPEEIINLKIDGGKITEAGVKNNISVSLQYLEKWVTGLGAVAIHNLMEDAATAEISRAQLWQWIKHSVDVHTSNGIVKCSKNFYITTKEEILRKELVDLQKYSKASAILDELVLGEWKWDFLTIPAYRYL